MGADMSRLARALWESVERLWPVRGGPNWAHALSTGPDRRPEEDVVVVSGLPRSGTSALMNMLHCGGFELVTDGKRLADESNPKGYFEVEAVKSLAADSAWLRSCRGRAVKVVSPLLQHLPPDLYYRLVFMLRPIEEVVTSQRRMLEREGSGAATGEAFAGSLRAHLQDVRRWLLTRTNFDVLFVQYRNLIEHPHTEAQRVAAFVGRSLAVAKMAESISPELYRERAGGLSAPPAEGK
jgi:hypothetical protein